MSSNEGQMQINTSSSSKWLLGWMEYVSKWIVGEDGAVREPSEDDDEFVVCAPEDWSEWEWVMSPTEEFLMKHSQWQIQKTESELDTIRGASSQVSR